MNSRTSRDISLFATKRRLKAKATRVFKIRPIVLNYIGVDSILLDPAVPQIFYFKHDVGASIIIILLATLTLITSATPSLTDEWSSGWSICCWNGRLGFDSRPGQTSDYKNWYLQLSCLKLSNKEGQCEASTVCGRQVGRRQLDLKTERSLRCLLVKVTWWIKCNYKYHWPKTRPQLE